MMDAFDAATSLDDLISAHDLFLNSILQKALLTSDDAPLLRTLKALFETILLFCEQQEALYVGNPALHEPPPAPRAPWPAS